MLKLLKHIMLVALLLFSFLNPYVTLSAQGNLLITPKRVIFDGTKKSHSLNLANIGDDTVYYDISLIHYKMKEDGSLEKIVLTDSSQNHADKHLRFYPHKVILAPHTSQSVRIQVTNWNELDTGEYRSNLYFRALPKSTITEDQRQNKEPGFSIKIIPVIGISMPIILQVGRSNSQVNCSNARVEVLNDTTTLLKATFTRSGNMSVYGDISIDHISLKGKTTRVGLIRGVAVYTPNPLRHFSVSLSHLPGVSYHEGKLRIVYSNVLLQNKVLTEKEIALN